MEDVLATPRMTVRRELVLSELRSRLFSTKAHALGRYELGRRLGSGGFGHVHEAYDPELDRCVAIKVLETSSDEILTEARAAAKLSHPNTVAIHDVGTAMLGDREVAYCVMELVDGPTAHAWIKSKPSVGRILDVWTQAAKGVAAAHAAGLIHRDIKPHNVLIGEDGRVRVSDFGLARASRLVADELIPTKMSDDAVTEVAGTPAYMAPEVLDHLGSTTSSDIYALCKCLQQQLAGRGSKRVARVIRRGLQMRPEDRHSSVDAFIRALNRARSRAVPVVVLTGLLGLGGLAWAADGSDQCAREETRVEGLWSEDRKSEFRQAFLTRGPTGVAARVELEEKLDRYIATLAERTGDACRVAPTDVQSPRRACLRVTEARVRGVIGAFLQPTPAVAEAASQTITELPSPEACSDPSANAVPVDTLESLAMGEEIMGVAEAGLLDEARRRLDHMPGSASAAHQRQWIDGEISAHEENFEAAQIALRASVMTSIERGDDATLSRAATTLGLLLGRELNRGQEGVLLTEMAVAASARSDRPSVLRGAALNNAGILHRRAGRLELAESTLHASLQAYLTVLPPHDVRVDEVRGNLSATVGAQGRTDEAIEISERALKFRRARFGDQSFAVARAQTNMGALLTNAQRYDQAVRALEEAVGIFRTLEGAKRSELAVALSNLAAAQWKGGKRNEAFANTVEALSLQREVFGANHPQVALTLNNLGYFALQLDDPNAAVEAFRKAYALQASASDLDPSQRATTAFNLALALEALGASDEALPYAQEALEGRRSKFADVDPLLDKAQSLVDRLNGKDQVEVSATGNSLAH